MLPGNWQGPRGALIIVVALGAVTVLAFTPPAPVLDSKGTDGGAHVLRGYTPSARESRVDIPSPEVSVESCPTHGCPSVGSSSSSVFWTNLTNPVSVGPLGTTFPVMTFDNLSRSVVLFGGGSENEWKYDPNQTWEFSLGQWRNITPSGRSPPADSGYAMAYDPLDGYVLFFGCVPPPGEEPYAECNDTWTFSAGSWSEVTGPNPLVRDVSGPQWYGSTSSLMYVPDSSYVLLTNGYYSWSYRGGTWTPLCRLANCSTGFIPGPNLTGVATYDAHDGYVLFVGAAYPNPCDGCGLTSFGNTSWTWKFSGGQWTNISSTAGSPPARIDPAISYDSSTGTVVLFGGEGRSGYTRNDTWSFQGGTWTNETTYRSPSDRIHTTMADDPPDSSMILFGGYTGAQGLNNDTWAWSATPPIAQLVISASPSVPIPGRNTTFNVSFRGGVGPFTYSWRFGDGGASSSSEPTHTFAANGIYLVNVWVNGSNGYVAHTSATFRAYLPLAVSAIHASLASPVLGQAVTLTAIASAGTPPYTYSWTFGDGATGGNQSSITHIYSTTGPFVAQVTVTDSAGGMVQASLTIHVGTSSEAGILSSPWVAALLGGSVGAVAVAAVWGGMSLRRRAKLRGPQPRGKLPPSAPDSQEQSPPTGLS